MRRTLTYALVGGAYGALLFAAAFGAAGAGHGTFLPFAVFGAPVTLLHPLVGLFAVLVIWPLGGLLFAATRHVSWRGGFLVVHALSVGVVLVFGSRFESAGEQWEYFARGYRVMGGEFVAYMATTWLLYIAGQVVAWRVLLRDWRADRAPALPGAIAE